MEAFARPDESECFFLGLAVPAFDVGERSAGVADWLRDAVVLLDDHCSESNRAGVCDDLGALGVVCSAHESTHRRMSPFGFGVTTTGLTQEDGPSTSSMMSFSMRSLRWSRTFGRSAKGTRRGRWATGVTVGLMWIVAWCPWSFPTPSKTAGKCCCRDKRKAWSSLVTLLVCKVVSKCIAPNNSDDVLPSRMSPGPSITTNVVGMVLPLIDVGTVNWPASFRGWVEPYA